MTVKVSKEIKDVDPDYWITWFDNPKNIMASLRNVVGFTDTMVVIRVKRFFFLQKTLQFSVKKMQLTKNTIGYKLESPDGSMGELAIIYDQPKRTLTIWATYVGKYEGQMKGLIEESLEIMRVKFLEEHEKAKRRQSEDLSHKLSLLSFTAKLVSTSKLADSLTLDTGQVDVSSFLIDLVHRFANYPVVLLVGVGKTGSFRVLLSNGDVKGAYARISNKEMFGDEALNNLSGEFKVSVYVNLAGSLKEILAE
ncbi:MAG: hypothetical protein ACP5HQ_07660 [Thermoprotei archaeon]